MNEACPFPLPTPTTRNTTHNPASFACKCKRQPPVLSTLLFLPSCPLALGHRPLPRVFLATHDRRPFLFRSFLPLARHSAYPRRQLVLECQHRRPNIELHLSHSKHSLVHAKPPRRSSALFLLPHSLVPFSRKPSLAPVTRFALRSSFTLTQLSVGLSARLRLHSPLARPTLAPPRTRTRPPPWSYLCGVSC
jgi:hypothetical protein